MVLSNNIGTGSGYSFPENPEVFKQNLLKISKDVSISKFERFRFQEMSNSFLVGKEWEWVDQILQTGKAFEELNYQALQLLLQEMYNENELIWKKILEENPQATKEELELLFAEQKIDIDLEDENLCFGPTITRLWAEAKNICQLSKSRNGIGASTAITSKHIHQQEMQSTEQNLTEQKGFWGSKNNRKEPESEKDLYE